MSVSNDHNTEIKVLGIGYSYRFSRGLLAHTLKSRGLDLDMGYKIALRVQQNLISQEINEILESELRSYVHDAAIEVTGMKIGDRYNLVERWHDSGLPLLILISGAKGMGKSELGGRLSSKFAFPKIVSTAIIVQILRRMITAELAPELHAKSYNAFGKLRPIYSILYDPVLIGYEEHAKFPAEAVEALVKRAINENHNMIIRGEHLLPRFLSKELISHPSIIYITLNIPDAEVHRKRYLSSYPLAEQSSRAKHFDPIRKIHNYLIEQAKSRNHEVVDATDLSEAMNSLEKLIYARLHRMFPSADKVNYDFKSYNDAVINS